MSILQFFKFRPALARGIGLAVLAPGLYAGLGAEARMDDWSGGYNSREAGLEDAAQTGRDERVYSLQQLETLRRAVAPRYVRVVNYRQYPSTRRYLEKGVLFTYYGYRSRRVMLAGDFNNWTPIPMHRNSMGVYYWILPVREVEGGRIVDTYKYKFVVDGIWTHDPTHQNFTDDGLGGYVSSYYLDRPDVNRQATVRVIRETRPAAERLVEFAIYQPNVENLSLVGDFNNWNPEHDVMTRGEDGIFRLRLRLRPGQYLYKYVADGRWILDSFNEDARYHNGIRELASFLDLK